MLNIVLVVLYYVAEKEFLMCIFYHWWNWKVYVYVSPRFVSFFVLFLDDAKAEITALTTKVETLIQSKGK